MKKKILTQTLIQSLEKNLNAQQEILQGHNKKYTVADAGKIAFTMAYTQQSSLKSHVIDLKRATFLKNCNRLFNIKKIPSDNQIRSILDTVNTKSLSSVFDDIFSNFERSGLLREFKINDQIGYAIAIDGIEFYRSKKIHCKHCLHCTHSNGSMDFYHQVMNMEVVHPSKNLVFPLAPEFIQNEDGQDKQDCEVNATKRLITSFKCRHKMINVTYLFDDLFSRQPALKLVLENHHHYIAACKPGSHKDLYEWVNFASTGGDTFKGSYTYTKKQHKYRVNYEYMNDVPLFDKEEGFLTNFMRGKVLNDRGIEVGEFAFVTDHKINEGNIKLLFELGRKRWKIENESHNTLTNHGYSLKHNFGHGKANCSNNFVLFILLAFLIHTITLYAAQEGLHTFMDHAGSRAKCFEILRNIFRLCSVDSWQELFGEALRLLE